MNLNGFSESAGYLGRGWTLIRQPGLRRFVWIPLAINLAIFGGLGWFAYQAGSEWLNNLSFFARFSDWWIVEQLQTLLRLLFAIVLLVSSAFLFTLLANLIGAPFNGLLAERVEVHLTGSQATAPSSLSVLVKSIPTTLGSEIRKLLYLAVWMLPLLLLHLIPVVNIVAPFVLFVFGAWMFALEYLDYPMGNHGMKFGEIKRRLKADRGRALGFGSMVALVSLIPIVNLIVMPMAVAGATALYVEQMHNE